MKNVPLNFEVQVLLAGYLEDCTNIRWSDGSYCWFHQCSIAKVDSPRATFQRKTVSSSKPGIIMIARKKKLWLSINSRSQELSRNGWAYLWMRVRKMLLKTAKRLLKVVARQNGISARTELQPRCYPTTTPSQLLLPLFKSNGELFKGAFLIYSENRKC